MIRLERDGATATLWLDRPEARNAVAMQGWHDLAAAAGTLAATNARLVLIRSTHAAAFSAGADLTELARLADHPQERAPFRLGMRAALDALAALPMPCAALVEGGCFGAGVALALAADLILVGPAARFAIPPARLGIGYPAEDVARLAARVGPGQAARLLFTGGEIDAAEALRIGLADLAGDAAAGIIAGNDPAALRLLKAMLADPGRPDHAAAFEQSFASARFAAGTARWRR